MANNVYCANIATGGATGSLDSIDGAGLADGDVAFLIDASNTVTALYTLNSSLGGAANPPLSVAPTANAGDKRWELTSLNANTKITLYDGTNVVLMQLISNVLELYTQRTSGVFRVSVTNSGAAKATALVATGSGSVDLYHNGTKKLETSATGATVTGALHETIPAFSRKNFIINGGMDVAQRATTGVALTTTPAYQSVDRFHAWQETLAQSDFGWSSTGLPARFLRQAALHRTNGSASTGLLGTATILETADAIKLAGQTVTLSLTARCGVDFSAAGSVMVVQLVSGTGSDEGNASLKAATWTGQTAPIDTTQVITTTHTRYSFTGVVPAGCKEIAVLVKFTPVGNAGADDTLYFTGVQLELGSVATPFEFRPFAEELALCQRYYEKSYNQDVTPGAADSVGEVAFLSPITGTAYVQVNFAASKFSTPSISAYAVVDGAVNFVYDATGAANVAVGGTVAGTGQSGGLVSFAAVDGRLYVFQWTATAEL